METQGDALLDVPSLLPRASVICDSPSSFKRMREAPFVLRATVLAAVFVALSACEQGREPARGESGSLAPPSSTGTVDVGGYRLSYECRGEGSPVVILEAGLDSDGTSTWGGFMPLLDDAGARVCAYDRAGTGTSDARPKDAGTPTAALQAEELHSLLEGARIEPPYVLVPHSYGGLVTRVFADRYRDEVVGFVFEDVSTAWEIDLWPKWDDSPWIDGGQKVDIQATEEQVLEAATLGDLPSIVLSQTTYDEEGIPQWAAPIFARQQARLAELGNDLIHLRADGTGHFIHDERPEVVVAAVEAVITAARNGEPLPRCPALFDEALGTCLS